MLSVPKLEPVPCGTLVLQPLGIPVTLRGMVVEHLRRAIVSGDLRPGLLLREVEIAKRLGVSATPVREAFAELAAEGLVEIEPNRLKRVAPIDVVTMMDLLRVQTALWRLGYQWSLETPDSIDIGSLETTLVDFEAALDVGNRLWAMRAAHEFHTLIVRGAGSSELLRVTLDRRSLMARFIVLHAAPLISTSALREHRAILASLKEGDADKTLGLFDQLSDTLTELVLYRAT
ncbi:MAG: GntR family transcriptional regulator [Janthinobacterium lividum]